MFTYKTKSFGEQSFLPKQNGYHKPFDKSLVVFGLNFSEKTVTCAFGNSSFMALAVVKPIIPFITLKVK